MTGATPTREELLADLAEADGQLLHTAFALPPEQFGAPSLLPGWTRGHVVTHLARNADAFRRVLTAAARGEAVPMYDSREIRDADIEAGAARAPQEQLADLREALRAFHEAVTAMPDEAWSFTVRPREGVEFPAHAVLAGRLREVEYHHVDLDAGYTPAHWPARFAERELEQLAAGFADRADAPAVLLEDEDTGRTHRIGAAGEPAAASAAPALVVAGPTSGLLAWLSGRAEGDGLTVHRDGAQLTDGRSALPALPPMG